MKFENLGVVVHFWSKSGGFDVIGFTYRPVSKRKRTQARIIENLGDLEDFHRCAGGILSFLPVL